MTIASNSLFRVTRALEVLAEDGRKASMAWACKKDDLVFWLRQGEQVEDLRREEEDLKAEAIRLCQEFRGLATEWEALVALFRATTPLAPDLAEGWVRMERERVPWGEVQRRCTRLGLPVVR